MMILQAGNDSQGTAKVESRRLVEVSNLVGSSWKSWEKVWKGLTGCDDDDYY